MGPPLERSVEKMAPERINVTQQNFDHALARCMVRWSTQRVPREVREVLQQALMCLREELFHGKVADGAKAKRRGEGA